MCAALALGAFALVASGCFVPREPAGREDQTCTRCHGDAAREGDARSRSAPPRDVSGNSTTDFPGVGAHALHLGASRMAAPVDCVACHVVPSTPDAPGHNDGVTQVVLARGGTWNLGARTCTNSGCHGPTSGVWTRPAEVSCTSCHGAPPAPPHPQAGACVACHADVVNADGTLKEPGKHVDGVVQVSAARCDACHGSDSTGAPPRSLDGGTQPSQRGVGAHARHLAGGATTRPVACASCHVVPPTPVAAQHPDGVVQVAGFDATTQTCATACHFGASPVWTSTTPLSCAGCHGAPPASPHPQVTQCGLCHATGGPASRGRHVDGHVDVAVPTSCDGCHGSAGNAAPPRDVAGNVDTTSPGVGAHQAHLVDRGFARVVQCEECHVVPSSVFAAGHLNGAVELRFSGVALANGASPTFAGGSCANTGCHDISHFTGRPGGGTNTVPVWTRVDGSQRTCEACHGAPPPPPHPAVSTCETCHLNVTAQKTFVNPARHINGVVDF